MGRPGSMHVDVNVRLAAMGMFVGVDAMLQRLAQKNGWNVFVTENAAIHNRDDLGQFDLLTAPLPSPRTGGIDYHRPLRAAASSSPACGISLSVMVIWAERARGREASRARVQWRRLMRIGRPK